MSGGCNPGEHRAFVDDAQSLKEPAMAEPSSGAEQTGQPCRLTVLAHSSSKVYYNCDDDGDAEIVMNFVYVCYGLFRRALCPVCVVYFVHTHTHSWADGRAEQCEWHIA